MLTEVRTLLFDMARNAVEMQKACTQCQEPLEVEESFFIQEGGDWRQPYLDLLLHRLLCRADAIKIKRKSSMFFVEVLF